MKASTICRYFLIVACLLPGLVMHAQNTSANIHVDKAGTLPTLISSADKYSITDLTLSGYLNGTDIKFIREMAGRTALDSITPGKVTTLNLTDANIVAGGVPFVFIFEYSYYDYTKDNSISSNMFRNLNNLTSLILPKSIYYLGSNSFKGCTKLTSIIIPAGVTTINAGAFTGCTALSSVTIPSTVTTIASSAFYKCTALSSIDIPNSVTSIGGNAFQECGLTSIIIPNSVTSIAIGTFYGCIGLKSVTIPNSVTSIANSAFYYCQNLTSVIIPSSVISIGSNTFSGCKNLISVTIPNSVTSIGTKAFSDCTGLTSLIIPSSVTSISDYAFSYCTGLTEIHSKALIPPTITSLSFTGISTSACKIYVPKGTTATYQASTGWKNFKNIVEEIPYYSISSSSNTGGTVTISNSSVKEGGSVTFTISPSQGYKITSATLNGKDVTPGIINNTYTIPTVTENVTLSVVFATIPQYGMNVTYNAGGKVFVNDSIVVSGNNAFVAENTSVTFKIEPEVNFAIEKVLLNNLDITAQLQNNRYTLTSVSANQSLNISFVRTHYNLTVNANAGGSIYLNEQAISSNVRIEANKPLTLNIKPDQGYYIASAILNNNDITTGIMDNVYTISSVNEDILLAVNFAIIPKHKISVTYNSGGKVFANDSIVMDSIFANRSDSITFRIEPDANYAIEKVLLNDQDIVSMLQNNKYKLAVSTCNTLVVTFVKTYYNLTVNANAGGSVYLNEQVINSNVSIEANKPLTLTFTPNQEYNIASATLNNNDITTGIINNTYAISAVNEDLILNVTFAAAPVTNYTINATYNSGGKIFVNDSILTSGNNISVAENDSVTLKFQPEDGYRLSMVLLNGNDITNILSASNYTIPKDTVNITISATFTEIPIYLRIEQADNGSIKQLVKKGSIFTYIIEPAENWKVNTIMFNGSDVTSQLDAQNQYTTPAITENSTLSISFESTNTIVVQSKASYSDINTANIQTSQSNIKVYTDQEAIVVTGAELGDVISVYSESGVLLQSTKVTDEMVRINVSTGHTYLIRTKYKTFKVAL